MATDKRKKKNLDHNKKNKNKKKVVKE